MTLTRVLLLLIAIITIINPQKLYTGVWRGGTDGYYLWAEASWANFNTKWSQLAGQGLRLIKIETYTVGANRYFNGLWRSGTDAYALTPLGLNWG